jgi:sulfane dehydrogenase subunit SoxC
MIQGGPGLLQISGLAWSGAGKINRVDISVDGGRRWHTARLEEPILSKSLTRFSLPWRWNGAPAIIASRAMDETGYVQPTREALLAERGENYVYHYNAIAAWKIAQDGKVTNAYAAGA